MKTIKWIGFAFLVLFLGSCELVKDDGVEDDPKEAEKLVGLWRGQDVVGRIVTVYNLRPDRSATLCMYDELGGVTQISTAILSSWSATSDMLYIGEEAVLYNRGGVLVGVDGSQLKEYSLSRIYNPDTGKGTRKLPSLAGKVWKGYFYDKDIELEFQSNGTITRTDSPNAGWKGTKQLKEYAWKIEDKVIKISDGTTTGWGVGVETNLPGFKTNLIYVDFGDVYCAFSDSKFD